MKPIATAMRKLGVLIPQTPVSSKTPKRTLREGRIIRQPADRARSLSVGRTDPSTGRVRATRSTLHRMHRPKPASRKDNGSLFLVLSMLAIGSAAACRPAPPTPATQVSADTWALVDG